MQMILSDIIKKWLKERKDDHRYRNWSVFVYKFDDTSKLGCIMCDDVISIAKDKVRGPYNTELYAYDPKFFSKLTKMMGFLEKRKKRYNEMYSEFDVLERKLLAEMLGM